MLSSNHIHYTIRTDGTCSYCGREAERYPIDDMNVLIECCTACDEYNSELEIDISIPRKIWETENQEEEFLQGG